MALSEPELFATYIELTAEARDVVNAHVATLLGQLTRLIADGLARGEFEAPDPAASARAAFDATTRFHNPVHTSTWADPDIDAAYEERPDARPRRPHTPANRKAHMTRRDLTADPGASRRLPGPDSYGNLWR